MPSSSMNEERKRYLVAQAIRYIRERPDGELDYDGTTCDGYCLADDLESEWDIESAELKG